MAAFGQVSNASVSGSYYFRHVLLVTDASGATATTSAGTITFNGTGGFTCVAQQLVGSAAPVALSGCSGTYNVKSGGVMTLTNPDRAGATLNARLGVGAIVGASTEAGPTVYDLFLAIPVAATGATNAKLTGAYYVSSLEYPGSITNVRNTNFRITANGSGLFTESAVFGQARNLNNRLLTQTLPPITYSVASDSTGTVTFPLASGNNEVTQLISGTKNIYVSADGNYFIGGSMTAGSHGMVVGVKAANSSSWSGFYYSASLRLDVDRLRYTSTTSAVNATTSGAVFGRRTRQSDGLFDTSALITHSLGADGSGAFTSTTGRVNVSASGNAFSTSGVDTLDSFTYELSFGVRMPTMTGAGVFIDPQRVLNGASFALGYPVSPGGFVTLFGSGLGPQTAAVAKTLPFPTTLGGVTVTVNGKLAPLYLVSSGQISLVVPYSTTGNTATIVVTNGTASNTVEVPLALTAPGIFSLTQNGIGDGAILHANYSVVNDANPASVGEVVQVFLSGMGAVTPSVIEGAAAPTATLTNVVSPVAVTIGGKPAEVSFNGLAPGLAGLYQLNVKVPSVPQGVNSLAVQTVEGFTDMVNIRVR